MAAFTAGQISALDSYTEGLVWNGLTQALIDLSLTGITTRWYIGKLAWLTDITAPCGIVANYDWAFASGGAVSRNKIRFRFIVAGQRASNLDNQNDIATMLDWTQKIRRKLHRAAATWVTSDAVARNSVVEIEEGRKFVDEAFRKMTDAFFFVVSVTVDEPHGTQT